MSKSNGKQVDGALRVAEVRARLEALPVPQRLAAMLTITHTAHLQRLMTALEPVGVKASDPVVRQAVAQYMEDIGPQLSVLSAGADFSIDDIEAGYQVGREIILATLAPAAKPAEAH